MDDIEKKEIYTNLERAIALVDTHVANFAIYRNEGLEIIDSLRKAIFQIGRVSLLEKQIDLLHQEIADLRMKNYDR